MSMKEYYDSENWNDDKDLIVSLQSENAELRKLVAIARCPNTSCSDGAIPLGPDPDGNWEAEQCQWCYEKDKALGDK